ncbi:MAG: uroporphyrinogen-III synthase [Methylohalobius crimeensis]
MPDAEALAGLRILVTRPRKQGRALCRAIESLGGSAYPCPMLEIDPVDPPPPDWWRGFDWLIFVSANAVRFALEAGLARAAHPPRLAAVGKATAAALREGGLAVACEAPPPYTSEALLAEPPFEQVAGQRILIVRGVGGRPDLGRTLTERGGRVEYRELYRRNPPHSDTIARLRSLLARSELDVVLVSSGEGLANLLVAAGEWIDGLCALPVVVVSPRSAEAALQAGFADVIEAPSALDEVVLETLRARFGLK